MFRASRDVVSASWRIARNLPGFFSSGDGFWLPKVAFAFRDQAPLFLYPESEMSDWIMVLVVTSGWDSRVVLGSWWNTNSIFEQSRGSQFLVFHGGCWSDQQKKPKPKLLGPDILG